LPRRLMELERRRVDAPAGLNHKLGTGCKTPRMLLSLLVPPTD
jgi:hypothetical protein